MKILINWIVFTLAFFNSLSAIACDVQLSKWPIDCQMQDEYLQIKNEFKLKYSINVNDLLEYQVLRFVNANTWEKKKEILNYNPEQIYSPAPETWNYWKQGEQFTRDHSIYPFNLETIKNLHKATINKDLMSFWAVTFKGAGPGIVRDSFWQLAPQFFYECANSPATQAMVENYSNHDIKNTAGKKMLRTYFKWCDENNDFLGQVYYLPSEQVPAEMDHWIDEMNNYKFEDISPVDFVASMQRKFIAIHPFGDGNGRISRFVQDAFLEFYNFPFPASGLLHKDIEVSQAEYRSQFREAMQKSMQYLKRCLSEYSENKVSSICKTI